MVNIAILASGEGTNAEKIIQYFNEYDPLTGKGPFQDARVSCVISNKENAGVLRRIRRYKVPKYFSDKYVEIDEILTKHEIHYVVLAGYLDKIPPNFCKKYQYRIINIHPSLLPKYGGKGMYGMNVHNAVKNNNETETGITIHFVNEEFDSGMILFQHKIKIQPKDTAEDIRNAVQILEHDFYPTIIEKLIKGTYNQLFSK